MGLIGRLEPPARRSAGTFGILSGAAGR